MIEVLQITQPEWLAEYAAALPIFYPSADARLALAVDLSNQNLLRRSGGPFGAAVFESESGRLVSIGVNCVVSARCALAHAELLALGTAQAQLKSHDLGADGVNNYELVSSAQMCAMCLGAALWSGVKKIVYAATRDDVQALTGFDEGPIAPDWEEQFRVRGIEIIGPRMRAEAREVLRQYAKSGLPVYNPRR